MHNLRAMGNARKSRNAPKAGSLQEAVEIGLAGLPTVFLEHHISKKLKEKMDAPPEDLARRMADHLLSGSEEPFIEANSDEDLKITIDDSDINEIEGALRRFQTDQLPELLRSMSESTARKTL